MPYVFAHDLQALGQEIEDAGVETIGKVDASRFEWPLDRTESLELLDVFCAELLPHFGDFQDAMTPGGWSLYHSRISFALNCKMLTPLEVIRRVESEYRKRKDEIDISQAEGFIRQILGWRNTCVDLLGAYARICATQLFRSSARLPRMVLDRGYEDGLFIRCDQSIPGSGPMPTTFSA